MTPTHAQIAEDLNDLAFVGSHKVELIFLPEAWAGAAPSSHAWVEVLFPPAKREDIQ